MEVKDINGGEKRQEKRRNDRRAKKQKPAVLLGFDAIAQKIKDRFGVLWHKKRMSSFSILVNPIKGGKATYSGGMFGDSTPVLEGLYYMALQRPEVRALLEITVNALRATDLQNETNIDKLTSEEKISVMTRNALTDNNITDLKGLAMLTKKEVLAIKNIGKKAVGELEALLEERNLSFKELQN